MARHYENFLFLKNTATVPADSSVTGPPCVLWSRFQSTVTMALLRRR